MFDKLIKCLTKTCQAHDLQLQYAVMFLASFFSIYKNVQGQVIHEFNIIRKHEPTPRQRQMKAQYSKVYNMYTHSMS